MRTIASVPRTILLLLPLCVSAAGQTRRDVPAEWSRAIGEAFHAYYDGQYVSAQALARAIEVRQRDASVRLDAAALAAMCSLRMPGRSERVAGQSQLAQLAAEGPHLLDRPDVQLASGIAHSALNETAAALSELTMAARSFERQGREAQLVEAWVELAETWAHFGEWGRPTPGVEVPQPQTPADADALRVARIRELRRKVAAIPGAEEGLARVDLALARKLLEQPETRGQAIALLEELTRRPLMADAVAEAALLVAGEQERERRWPEALRALKLAARSSNAELVRQAERGMAAIERPQVDVDVPQRLRPRSPTRIGLKTRNVPAVQLEIRRVDLAAWLTERHGVLAEASLPTSGAVEFTSAHDSTVPQVHDWWEKSIELELPAGAYVVTAEPKPPGDAGSAVKRLLIVSALDADVFCGPSRALVATSAETEAEIQFWMAGSIAPATARAEAGVAAFALPAEARLLRDRAWSCLIQSGSEVALCSGKLPEAAGDPTRPVGVVVTGGPPAPRIGQMLTLAGVLAPASGAVGRAARPVELKIALVDTLDATCAEMTAEVGPSGEFACETVATPAMAGKALRTVVRQNGRIVPSLYRSPQMNVESGREGNFAIRLAVPEWLKDADQPLSGLARGAFPWGSPLANGDLRITYTQLDLPFNNPLRPAHAAIPAGVETQLDDQGSRNLLQPLGPAAAPLAAAIGTRISLSGADQRIVSSFAQTLVSPRPAHVWLRPAETTIRVGQPLEVMVGWFDPQCLAQGMPPTLRVRRQGGTWQPLALLPAAGDLRSESWTPWATGAYELQARLALSDGQVIAADEAMQVAENPAPVVEITAFEALEERAEDTSEIRVRLTGRSREPLLVLAECGDPLQAQWLTELDGQRELRLPAAMSAMRPTRVLLLGRVADELVTLGAARVAAHQSESQPLAFSFDAVPRPGDDVRLRVRATQSTGTLLSRLVDAQHTGTVPWKPDAPADRPADTPVVLIHVTSSAAATPADADALQAQLLGEPLSPQLVDALLFGQTLWAGRELLGPEPTTLRVPLPDAPGLYRIRAAAGDSGRWSVGDALVDASDDLHLSAELPDTLQRGDRTFVAVRAENRSAAPHTATVRAVAGRTLEFGRWQWLGDATVKADEANNAWTVTLAPHSASSARIEFEAAKPGRDVAAFTLEGDGMIARAEASYRVLDAPQAFVGAPSAASSGHEILLRRRLFRLEEDQPQQVAPGTPANPAAPSIADDRRYPVSAGDRLAPGTLVLVVEEFELAAELRQVEWTQRTPSHCVTYAGGARNLNTVAPMHDWWLNRHEYFGDSVRAGKHVHEYALVTQRPGVCGLPLPEVRAGGKKLSVAAPADLRITVAE